MSGIVVNAFGHEVLFAGAPHQETISELPDWRQMLALNKTCVCESSINAKSSGRLKRRLGSKAWRIDEVYRHAAVAFEVVANERTGGP